MSTGKKNFNNPDYYQPVVIYNQPIKVGFHTEHLAYPFYSPSVFLSEEDATKFLVTFVKGLLRSGDIPADALTKSGQLNDKLVRTAVYPVIVTEMELDAD